MSFPFDENGKIAGNEERHVAVMETERADRIAAVPAVLKEGRTEAAKDCSDETSLKERYGTLYYISQRVDNDDENDGRLIEFYFKTPTQASFNRYLKSAGKNMAVSTTVFVRDNVISEQKDRLEEEFRKYPGLSLSIGQKLLAAIGMGDETNFRKL